MITWQALVSLQTIEVIRSSYARLLPKGRKNYKL